MRIRLNPSYSFWMSGSGLLWCWGFLHFFWSQSSLSGSDGSVLGDLPYLGATLLVSVVVASVATNATLRRFQMRLAMLGCAMLVLGIILSIGSQIAEANASELRLLADIAQGGGVGVFFIAWGCLYVRCETEAVEYAFLGWFPLLVVLLVAAAGINLLEQGAAMLYSGLQLLLPIASLACFRISAHRVDEQGEGNALLADCCEKSQDDSASHKGVVWPLLNLACVFAATSLAWNAFLFRTAIRFETQIVMFAFGITVLFVIIWLALRMTRHFSLSTLYRWTLPLVAVGVVLYQFSAVAYVVPVFLCLSIVNTGFEVMGKLVCVYMAKRNSGYAVVVVAVGFATASMGGIVGTCVWAGVLDWFGGDASGNTLLVALVVFVFAASFALGNDHDSRGDGGSFVLARRGFSKSARVDARVGAEVLSEAPEERIMPEASALTEPVSSEPFAVERLEPGDFAVSDIAAGSASERSAEGDRADGLTLRCVAAAERHGLSARELDVLILLSQGRSRAHIREVLYISKGTVDSHIHHIYSKMGIASKDELMRQLLD